MNGTDIMSRNRQAGSPAHHRRLGLARSLERSGRVVALAGLVLPLLLIGGMKFTQVEVDALKPLMAGTPWLAWMPLLFGAAGASYVLGIVELAVALLLIASPWSPRAGVLGGAVGALTFLVTVSLFFSLPVWDRSLGFPALGPTGQFLIKDIALLGIALAVTGESLVKLTDAKKAA